jgi:hypothetical protein
MLKHSGSKRTHKHNIQLAVMLGLNAGFVNAAGFLAFAVLNQCYRLQFPVFYFPCRYFGIYTSFRCLSNHNQKVLPQIPKI